MELILKIELTRLTDEARNLLMEFVAASDPKPLKTELEKKLEKSVKEHNIEPFEPPVKKKDPLKKLRPPAKHEEETDDETKDPFDEDDGPSANGTETALDLETIKAKVIALRDKGKRDKTLKVMQKFNVAKLSDLEEDDYDSFMAALNNIK